MLKKFSSWLLVGVFAVNSLSLEGVMAQVSPVSGNSVYSNGAPNRNFNMNAQVRNGAAPANNLTNMAPVQSVVQGNFTTRESPAINATGTKVEGTWNVSFQRTEINNFGQLVNDSAVATIRFDQTRPRCPIVNAGAGINEWPTGLNGGWASANIEFYADDRFNYNTNQAKPGFGVCRDQITEQGVVTDVAGKTAGCQANNAKKVISNCGATLTFDMYDRVGNGPRTCTTPPAMIDKGAPIVNTMQIEHRGLGLAPESKGTSGNPRKFKAHDGQLYLLIDVADRPGGGGSCESGLNWNQVVQSEEINQKRGQLLQLMQRRDQLVGVLNQLKSAEVLEIANRLANYYIKGNITLNLNLWKRVSEEIEENDSYVIEALDDLESTAANLASRDIDGSTFQDVLNEINKSKFDDVGGINGIRNTLAAFNINQIESRKNNAMTETSTLINSFSYPDLDAQENIISDNNTLSNYTDEWNSRKNEDYSFYIPNWEQSVDDVDSLLSDRFNNFYIPYRDALFNTDLATNIDDLELGFTVTDDIADLIFDIIPDAKDTHEDRINDAISRINQYNSRVPQTLSDLQGYTIVDPPPTGVPPNVVDPPPRLVPNFDYSDINSLIDRATNMSQAIATVDGDVDPVGILGRAFERFNRYFDNGVFDQRISRREDLISNALTQDGIHNAVIDDNRDEQAQINVQIAGLNGQISDLQDDISDLEAAELNNTDLQELGISHVEIERVGTGKVQSFIDSTMAPVGGDNFEWNVNQYKFTGEEYPIFAKAGTYRITVRIYDNAYNPINPVQRAHIQILPAEADKTKTELSLTHNCTADNLFANLQDACQVNFTVQDRFENIVTPGSQITTYAQTQDTEGSYDVIAEDGNNYLNGVRLQGGVKDDGKHKLNWSTNASGARTINVRQILPTVNVIKGINSAALMSPITKNMPMQIIAPQVNARGVVQSTKLSFNLDVPTLFKPWVFLFMSDNPGNTPPSVPWEVAIDSQECLYAYTTTTNNSADLPPNYTAFIRAHTDSNVETYNENLSIVPDGKSVSFSGINDWRAEELICTHIRPTGGQANLEVGFTSKIRYQLDGKPLTYAGNNLGLMAGDTCIFPDLCPACQGGSCPIGCVGAECDPSCPVGETCTEADPCVLFPNLCTPSTPTPCELLGTCPTQPDPPCLGLSPEECLCDVVAPGSCVEFDYVTAGADIEGGVLVETEDFIYVSSDDSDLGDQAQFLGGNTEIDVREEATRNAFELTRGRAPEINSGIRDFDLTGLEDGGVTYIRGGLVRIGNGATEFSPEIMSGGRHTLIVEEGNVLFAGDTEYQSVDDILGIMVINEDPTAPAVGSFKTTGNVFVHKDVQAYSAVIFADGSLATTESKSAPTMAESFDNETINGNLSTQLIQTGSLLTRNTLGGSQLVPDAKDPWGRTTTVTNAQKYDLHHIRRYSPLYNGSGVQQNSSSCTELSGACYDNKHSFVVRIDQRISYNPPPGFTVNDRASFQSR